MVRQGEIREGETPPPSMMTHFNKTRPKSQGVLIKANRLGQEDKVHNVVHLGGHLHCRQGEFALPIYRFLNSLKNVIWLALWLFRIS